MTFQTKERLYLIAILLLIAACGQFYYSYHYLPERQREVSVYYNQHIKANQQIIDAILDADQYVYFAIYTFTRPDIKDALLGAKHRGLTVIGLTDKQQMEKIDLQKDIIKELRAADIPVYTQNHQAIMHLKTLVTDHAYVSGSYNWTASATTSNDEVLEVGRDEQIRRQYEQVLKTLFDLYQTSPAL